MPAPPSRSQREANARSMAASQARSDRAPSRSAPSGGGGPDSGDGPRSGRDDRQPSVGTSTSPNNARPSVGNPAANRYGGPGQSVADIASRNWADTQRQAAAVRSISPNSMPGNSNPSLNYGPGTDAISSLMREADRRANAARMATQYSQYRSVPPNVNDLTRDAYDREFSAAPANQPSTFPGRPGFIAPNNVAGLPFKSPLGFDTRPKQALTGAVTGEGQPSFIGSPSLPSFMANDVPNFNPAPLASYFRAPKQFTGRVPAGNIPTPRQNPLRNTDLIRTDNTFDATSDFGTIDGATLSRLVSLQARYGKPVTVTEGSAPAGTHVPKSQHHINPATGKSTALDISVPTRDRAQVVSLADQVGFGGLGTYGLNLPNMVHVDTGPVRSWGPKGKRANISQLKDSALRTALLQRGNPVMAANPPPPKATVARALAPALQGIKNFISPPSIPIPRQKPMVPSIVARATSAPTPRMKPSFPSQVARATSIPRPRSKPAQTAMISPASTTPAQQSLQDVLAQIEQSVRRNENSRSRKRRPIRMGSGQAYA